MGTLDKFRSIQGSMAEDNYEYFSGRKTMVAAPEGRSLVL